LTFGTLTVAGPVLTVRLTVDPEATLVPAPGDSLITSPDAAVGLLAIDIEPTVSPAPVIAELALACVSPTTFGTLTLVVVLPPPPPPPPQPVSARSAAASVEIPIPAFKARIVSPYSWGYEMIPAVKPSAIRERSFARFWSGHVLLLSRQSLCACSIAQNT
jgi:hypothetical protein